MVAAYPMRRARGSPGGEGQVCLAGWRRRSGIAAEPFGVQRRQIIPPAPLLLTAELVQILPGIDPGIVQIVEQNANGVMADGLDRHDADMPTSRHCLALGRGMALNLGARA